MEIDDAMATLVMRAHSRMGFKSCRRRWSWMDGGLGRRHLNLDEDESPAPALWFGSAFHYAMEDFHGYRVYDDAFEAFVAYAYAGRALATSEGDPHRAWPDNAEDLFDLGRRMLHYYTTYWLPGRELRTVWIDGVPQCELEFELVLPWDPREWYPDSIFTRVVHQGTIDRLVHNPRGGTRWWALDYKTAKRFEVAHLDTDAQVSAYLWACSVLYPGQVEGLIYQQHKKAWPNEPKLLANGKLSTSSSQGTTYLQYRHALQRIYGEPRNAPAQMQFFLAALAESTSRDSDPYIRRDEAVRNDRQHAAELQKIMGEALDMANPRLPIYPNPTRACGYCPVEQPCIALDDGSDYEFLLDEILGSIPQLTIDVIDDSVVDPTDQPNTGKDRWRNYLPSSLDLKAFVRALPNHL